MISLKQWTALLIVYILYLLLGGLVFLYTERGNEIENLKALHRQQRRLTMLSNLIENEDHKLEIQLAIQNLELQLGKNLLVPKSVQNLIINHLNDIKNGNKTKLDNHNKNESTLFLADKFFHSGSGGLNKVDKMNQTFHKFFESFWKKHDVETSLDENEAMWTLWNSFFFSFTAITTIGFGHMSPKTTYGKVFCLIYSIFGVPFNGIVFAGLADLFALKFMKRIDGKRYEDKGRIVLDVILFLIPGMIVFFVVPAFIFMAIEGWDYITSLYFTFITLSTIGFGDLVSGYVALPQAWMWVYRIFIQAWIIFGLGYLVMIISFIQRALRSKHLRAVDRKMAKLIRNKKSKKDANLITDLDKLGAVLKNISKLRGGNKAYPIQDSKTKKLLPAIKARDEGSEGTDNPAFTQDDVHHSSTRTSQSEELSPEEESRSVEIFLELAKTVLTDKASHAEVHSKGNHPMHDDELGNEKKADEATEYHRKTSMGRRLSNWTLNVLGPTVGKKVEPKTEIQSESSNPTDEDDDDDDDVDEDQQIYNFGELIEKVEKLVSQEMIDAKRQAQMRTRQRSTSMYISLEDHFIKFPNQGFPLGGFDPASS